jgi:hypothetical protein
MTTIFEMGASSPVLGSDLPRLASAQTSHDCMSGGYSVWACPPPQKRFGLAHLKRGWSFQFLLKRQPEVGFRPHKL